MEITQKPIKLVTTINLFWDCFQESSRLEKNRNADGQSQQQNQKTQRSAQTTGDRVSVEYNRIWLTQKQKGNERQPRRENELDSKPLRQNIIIQWIKLERNLFQNFPIMKFRIIVTSQVFEV